MALLNSPENVQAFIEAEVTPLAKSASSGAEVDARTTELNTMLNEAPAIVLPPDTGYDLKMADAFYAAASPRCWAGRPPRPRPSPRSTASSAARNHRAGRASPRPRPARPDLTRVTHT